jgi:N-acetylglutamate synthase-like GNAT family acetyltransferase
MENGLCIRRATENDAESAYQLITALGYPQLDRNDFGYIYKVVITHPESLILLAENDEGQIIGLMTISHRPQLRLAGTILCIDELVVSNEARGGGAGRALLEYAKQRAIEMKAERIELHTRRNRESYKRQFYIKNGFTEANSALMRLEKTEFNI